MDRLSDDDSNETNQKQSLDGIVSGDGLWGKWRAVQAWEITVETPIAVACVLWRLMNNDAFILDALVKLTPLITVYMGARYAVLGVHLYRGSQEREIAITGAVKSSRAD